LRIPTGRAATRFQHRIHTIGKRVERVVVVILVNILKSELATQFTIYSDYSADFSEYQYQQATCRHRPDENSRKLARHSIYHLKSL